MINIYADFEYRLFSSPRKFNFERFVSDVNNYVQTNPLNKRTINKILDIFYLVRPKQHELLAKIENATSIAHSRKCENFEEYPYRLPKIFKLDTTKSPIVEFIKNDDVENLQKITSVPNFNFDQSLEIECSDFPNLLDVSAYYGSVKCFKFLFLNRAPFSKFICPFSICGGNKEIFRIVENEYKQNNFDDEICLTIGILYHRYKITEYLVLNYHQQTTNVPEAIKSFNFPAFKFLVMNEKPSRDYLEISSEVGNLPVIQYLFDVAKVNPEEKLSLRETPLHYACKNGFLDIVQYPCEVKKVNPETKALDEQTPLYFASEYGHMDILKYLCEVQKVNPEIVSRDEKTLLHNVCLYDSLETVQFLCEVVKVNPEAADKNGQTPLHIACLCGYDDIVQYLCEVAKVNPETADINGHTPLHIVCICGNLDIVKYLCEVAKVNIEIADKNGQTPLHKACENDYLETVQYLCEVQKVNLEIADING